MIEFITLFFALITGPHPVAVEVEPAVDTVEFRLDGKLVDRRQEAPWQTVADFGSALRPQELEAVALGADGTELGRVSQWINLPRPRAEARLKLLSPRTASLSWQAVDLPDPTDIEITFDNRDLAFSDPKAIPLPGYGDDQPHFLAAQVSFTGDVQAGALLTLSGDLESIESELTAIPVWVGERARAPTLDRLRGAFLAEDQPVLPIAVDHGPADIVVVQDFRIEHELFDRAAEALPKHQFQLENLDALGPGDRLKSVAPVVQPAPGGDSGRVVFPTYAIRDGSIAPGVVRGGLRPMLAPMDIPPQRLADAVAVAGRVAAQSNRRRAVVLLLSSETEDTSRFDPQTVRRYLQSLRVPLHIWTLEKVEGPEDGSAVPPAFAGWGPVESLYRPRDLISALTSLNRSLRNQYVVWVEGRHLPNRVQVSETKAGLRLAGGGGAS